MQAKNWLFEAAMESGDLTVARRGFETVRSKVSPRTRIYLEATALLAICNLRESNISLAEPLIAEVLRNEHVIRNKERRRDFRLSMVARFEEEAALAMIRGHGRDRLVPEKVQTDAGHLVQRRSQDELLEAVGSAVPIEAVATLLKLDRFARGQLTSYEIKLLPSPEFKQHNRAVGNTIFGAFKRVVWRSLCDPESEIYQAWFNDGMRVVLSKGYISGAIVASLYGMGIGIHALAVSLTALVLKMGIETYCDTFRPDGVMEIRRR